MNNQEPMPSQQVYPKPSTVNQTSSDNADEENRIDIIGQGTLQGMQIPPKMIPHNIDTWLYIQS